MKAWRKVSSNMNIDYSAIGKRIRSRRKELHFTQAVLAEKADLSDTNIFHIERGATKLSLPSLIAIANALETTTDSLLMDVTEHSEAVLRKEFAALLEDCTVEKYRLLYNSCKALLDTLRLQKV